MTVGSDTFIDSILTRGGFVNVIKEKRYPELTAVEMHALNPEIIFMSSEPYPFKENHIEELRVYFPEAEIKLVNGELFSWYGSRLIQTPSYLLELNKALIRWRLARTTCATAMDLSSIPLKPLYAPFSTKKFSTVAVLMMMICYHPMLVPPNKCASLHDAQVGLK